GLVQGEVRLGGDVGLGRAVQAVQLLGGNGEQAAGLAPLDAASVAAYLHGLAGREAAGEPGAPTTALAVAGALPAVWRAVREELPTEPQGPVAAS
ncbi:hypothetical protein ABZW03_16220, partial [Kitasatospora sp. NPDC004799]